MYMYLADISVALGKEALLATVVYAILGTIILMLAYKVFDLINPLDFDKEIAKNSVALGVMVAGFFFSVALIITAAIVG